MTPELSQAYAAAEIATEKVARLTERVRELEADAERYRFLRQPGNAIVYAASATPWVTGNTRHVRYDSPEQLDIAIDAVLAKGIEHE